MKLYFELSICNSKHFLGVFSTADDATLVPYYSNIGHILALPWSYGGHLVVL